MSYFSEICDDLNLLDNTPEVCQQYIDQTHSHEADQFCPNLTNEMMMDLIKNVYKYSTRLESSSLGDLKCICAAALSTLFHSTESDSIILASRLLISLCSVPSASAYGLSNSNVYNSFLTCLSKVVGSQLKSTTTVAANAGKAKKRTRKTDEDASGSDADDDQEDEADEFNINIVSENAAAPSLSQATLSQRSSARRPVGESAVEMSVLKPFLTDLGDHIPFLAVLSDEHLNNSTAELLTALLFFCSVKLQNHSVLGFVNQISKSIVEFGVSNQRTLMSIYRSLMPCLTMVVRNPMLPDVQKVRTAAHKAAVKVMNDLIKQSSTAKQLFSSVTSSTESEDLEEAGASDNDDDGEDGNTTPTKKNTKSSLKDTVSVIPLPFKCLIGLLQRMTVGCPDRAPVRATILHSVTDMLTQLYEFQSSNRGVLFSSDAEGAELEFELQCVVESVGAIQHYIKFLSALSRSNKVGHRAFSLDIATGLLSTSWVWELTSTSTAAEPQKKQSAAACLMNMLLSRCSDASPSVRMRALNAVDDLLLALNDQSSHAMISCLFDVAMGSSSSSGGNVSFAESEEGTAAQSLSLLDILRERCDDDKPLVRAKALQAYGRAISMSWPRVVTTYKTVPTAGATGSEGEKMETSDDDNEQQEAEVQYVPENKIESSQLVVTEEDLSVLAEHCTDVSLAARKQALQSLTEVLLNRPSAGNIMDLFLSAALPLAFDPESTVVAKLSQSLYELVFVSLYQWHDHFGPRGAGTTGAAGLRDRVSLVWRLCNKISTMGLLKVLKSVVGSMIRSSILKGHSDRSIESRASSLSHIVEMLKFCCCVHLPSSHDVTPALSAEDRSEVSRGAWILLETLVSQEQMNVVTGSQTSVPVQEFFQKTGSVDFVLRCYRSKHTSADDLSGGQFDAEDLRIFKVLEKLVVNIAPSDAEFVSGELNRLLLDLQSNSQLVAAAVSVKFQLSKLIGGSQDFKKTCADIQKWASDIMSSVYVLLHIYAFGTVADTSVLGVLSAPLQSLVQSWLMDRNQSLLNNSAITLNQSTFFDLSTLGGVSNANQSVDELLKRVVNTALFTLGELGMIGFRVEEDAEATRNQKSLKDASGSTGHWSLKGGVMQCKMSETGDSLKLLIPEDVNTLVKIFMGHTLPVTGGSSEGARECPVQVRANAFITMGKVCLRDKDLARDHVNIFLREITVSSNSGNTAATADNAAVRSNALLILGDLCVRYTHLVDRHVDTMSHCLQDPDSSVRRNALILLTQLLLQDFLKWKGFLLYRFLSLVVDADYEIAEFARSLLTTTLQQKFPELLSGHLPEAVVVLNNCNTHPIYSAIVSTNIGNNDNTNASVESEVNPLSRAQRMEIYSFMSEKLTDELKIQVTAKLVQDILALAVDSDNLLPNRSKGAAWVSKHYELVGDRTTFEGVLEDTLMILRSTILKVGSKKGGSDDQDEEDLEETQLTQGGESQKAAMAKAKTKVLKKLSTQHLVNHVLPVVISLKHVLEATKSPLQGMLMEYLMVLVKNHKGEVEQTLQYDPTLKEELEFDMKQYEKIKAAEAAAKATAAARTKSPARLSISSAGGIHSVLKPSLKKSLLNQDMRGKTPVQVMLLASGMKTRDALLTANKLHPLSDFKARHSLGGGGAVEDEDDVVDRLLSQSEPAFVGSSKKAAAASIGSVKVSDADMDDSEAVDDMIAGMQEDMHIAALVSSGLKAPMPRVAVQDGDSEGEEVSPSRRTNKVLFQDEESSGKAAFASTKSRRSWSVVACNIQEAEVENLPVVNKNRVSIGKKPTVTSHKRPTEAVAAGVVVPPVAAAAAESEEQEEEAFDRVVEKYTPVKKRTKRGAKGSPTHPLVKVEADSTTTVNGAGRSRLSGGESNSLAGGVLSGTASTAAAAKVAVASAAAAGGRGSRMANVASDSLFQAMR